jgi:signal transduction histidine kinase
LGNCGAQKRRFLRDSPQLIRRSATLDAVRALSEMRSRAISWRTSGEIAGMFEQKLERAFLNLVLNAFEASARRQSAIEIDIRSYSEQFEIRVIDHGPGVPAPIRDTLFDLFVSFGQSTGTGQGLAIVNKIVRDHAGRVAVETTSLFGTTFLVKLPCAVSVLSEPMQRIIS